MEPHYTHHAVWAMVTSQYTRFQSLQRMLGAQHHAKARAQGIDLKEREHRGNVHAKVVVQQPPAMHTSGHIRHP